VHKLSASIHENDLDRFEAWFTSQFEGRKDSYSVDSFAQDPKSTGVLYAVSLKIARQGDIEALKTYLAEIGAPVRVAASGS
jgi:hypothetical protein